MASESHSIVENWLRSVNLVHYTASFMDNGYDDLEVCKQIGEADLDAIGVSKDDHRERLLRAVKILKEEGGTAVYFTLEECDTCQSGDETEAGDDAYEEYNTNTRTSRSPAVNPPSSFSPRPGLEVVPSQRYPSTSPHQDGSAYRLDAYDVGKTTLLSYPGVQLKMLLRDRLVLNNIDLSSPPYTTKVSVFLS